MPVVQLCHCGHPKPCPTHHRHRNGRDRAAWRYRTRPAVLLRDSHTCQLRYPGCTTQATHVHRIDRDYHDNEPTAYQSACLSCHTKAHNHAA